MGRKREESTFKDGFWNTFFFILKDLFVKHYNMPTTNIIKKYIINIIYLYTSVQNDHDKLFSYK